MPFQAEQGIIPAHAAAIIGHPNQCPPARTDLDQNPGGPCVQGILDEFLDHAGRALDDFASGDLVGNLLGQQVNPIHPLSLEPSFGER